MKKNYTLFILALAMVFTGLNNLKAQRVVTVAGWDVAADPTGSPDTYNNLLFDAINADSTLRKTEPNVIYELKRGHYYPMGKRIENRDFKLHLRAEAGDGFLPELQVGKNTGGGYGEDYIWAYNDITLENISFNGFRPDEGVLNRMIEIKANKVRYEILGCAFDGDRGGFVVPIADSVDIIIRNSTFGNGGHRTSYGGNGRLIDFSPEVKFIDTCIVENVTGYYLTDRMIRNQGAKVNYLKIDHVTMVNNEGVHGCIQLGNVKTAIITNSVFANAISLGHSDYRTNEQNQDDKHFAIITLDTIFDGQSITIRNNNIYSDQSLIDVWAKYDTVSAPNAICATTQQAIGAGNLATAFFSEPLQFTNLCSPITEFVDAYYTNPTEASFPENWCVGGQGGFFYDQIDVSYANTYQSYTADDNGNPVGCLLNFDIVTGISDIFAIENLNVNVYPNPFMGQTTFKLELEVAVDVKISLYNVTGSELQVITNENLSQGLHEIELNGSLLSAGVYYYKIEAGSASTMGKLIHY